MAGHHLIGSYLATLARQLPADAIDELGSDPSTQLFVAGRSRRLA
jgi:hypothetical protein